MKVLYYKLNYNFFPLGTILHFNCSLIYFYVVEGTYYSKTIVQWGTKITGIQRTKFEQDRQKYK